MAVLCLPQLNKKTSSLEPPSPAHSHKAVAAAVTCRPQVQQSFQASLRNLGTYYLDSLVLHSPLPSLDQTLDVWHAFEDIHASGGARRLGISNCYDLQTLRDLHARAKVKPSVVQASAVGRQLLQNRKHQASDRQQACLLNR